METVKHRLNPFLFSPDTNFRFILLIVSVLGASLFAYNNLYNQLNRQEILTVWSKCFDEADKAYPLDVQDPTSFLNQAFLHNRFLNDCQEPLEQSEARWILLGLGLLLLVAGTIYWLMPAARIRRDQLKVFSSEDDPAIMACLLDLCSRAELKRRPVFLLRALNPSPSGLAFGHLGGYYVVLNGGLIVLFHQDQQRFNAIVLHELAHLRNQDVDKTYFSLALGISFLLMTLIPLFIGNVVSLIENFTGNIGFVLWQLFSAAIYLPLIYIALASILRSREVYADARVVLLDGQTDPLRNELRALVASPGHSSRQIWGLHPNPAWRLKVFDEPDLLFGLSYWDAFLAGIISTFALRELDIFLSTLLPTLFETYSLVGASLFFIPFVATIVGLGVWQKVFADQIHSRELAGYGRYGLSLGTGMLVGMALSFSSFVDNSLAFSTSSIWGTVVFNVFLGVLLLISLYLIFRWVATGASVWLETVTHPENLRSVSQFGLLTTGVMMSFWVGGFYLLYEFGYEVIFRFALLFAPALQRLNEFEGLGLSLFTESIVASITLLTILFTTPMVLFIVFWVLPLLSKLRKSRTRIENIFIGQDQAVYLPARIHSELRPYRSFLTGLLVAIGFLAIMILLRVWLHFSVDPVTRTTPQWVFNFRIILIGLALVIQIVLAAAVSATVRALGWAHGLFAAFVAGLLISIGLAILPEIGDCISILSLGTAASCGNFLEANLALWVGPILVLGWVFSVIPAFIASWSGSFVRSLNVRPSPS